MNSLQNESLVSETNSSNSSASNLTTALHAAVIIFIMTLIILGNLLVLIVTYRQRSRPSVRVANMFIANLAVVDLSIAVLLFPFSVVTILLRRWPFGEALCKFNGATNMMAGAASILIMAVISFDRYRAIVSPPGSKITPKQAWVLLAIVWTWSIIIGVLPGLGWNQYAHSSLSTMCKISFSEGRGYILLVIISCFVIPLLTMFYCYLRIFLKVRFHKRQVQRWSDNRQSQKNFRRETKTAQVVFTVLFVFVVCWTPFVIVHFLQSLPTISISRIVFHSVTLVAGVHSACNPIIYITMNRTFRNELHQVCQCVICGRVKCCGADNLVQPLSFETSFTQRS